MVTAWVEKLKLVDNAQGKMGGRVGEGSCWGCREGGGEGGCACCMIIEFAGLLFSDTLLASPLFLPPPPPLSRLQKRIRWEAKRMCGCG